MQTREPWQERLRDVLVLALASPYFLIGYIALFLVTIPLFRATLAVTVGKDLREAGWADALGDAVALYTGSDPSSLPIHHCRSLVGIGPTQGCRLIWDYAWFGHTACFLLLPAVAAFLVAEQVAQLRRRRKKVARRALEMATRKALENVAERFPENIDPALLAQVREATLMFLTKELDEDDDKS